MRRTPAIYCAWCRDGVSYAATETAQLVEARRHAHACPDHPAVRLEKELAEARAELWTTKRELEALQRGAPTSLRAPAPHLPRPPRSLPLRGDGP